ncbi:MAG: hypothetical protein ABR548_05140 [Actinomycetota bacterium]|nr:hypothetical protein [Actinomycetota bacterium]
MTERIEGRVAQILNSRELVLNRGAADGVQVGMRFAILNRKGADIRDPETDEVLGSVEVEKALVKVVRVHERLAVARTFRTTFVSGILGALSGLTTESRHVPETLKTDERTYQQELDESESFVKRGDPAIQIVGEEFSDE